jgi:precorrin-3B methylase
MPSIDKSFEQAIANFSKRLTKQELDDFKFSSLSDVLVAVEDIQARQCLNSPGTMLIEIADPLATTRPNKVDAQR